MRFEEAYGGWQSGRLTQIDAARLLGGCDRRFRRSIARNEHAGLEGLVDRRLAQVSHRRAPVDEVMAVVERYRSRHAGWNVKHFYAWYKREGGSRSSTWVKNRLQEAFGRAMAQLGIEMIPADLPEARGRSERMFRTHQDWLPKELAAAAITDMAAANRYLKEVYLPAFNAEFMQPALEEGAAFVP